MVTHQVNNINGDSASYRYENVLLEECEGKDQYLLTHMDAMAIFFLEHITISLSSTLTSLCGGHPGVAGSFQVFLDVLDSLEDLVEALLTLLSVGGSSSLFSVPATG